MREVDPPVYHPAMRFSDDLQGAFDDDGREDPELADELEEEFPLGDGTAETGTTVWCPWCGEPVEIALDPGSGAVQQYVEDCEVCCRPWRVTVAYHGDGSAGVSVEALE